FVKDLKSVCIGGGTPVARPTDALKKVLTAMGYKGVEYTVEAGRPDCIDYEKLKLLADFGVTRICVNPQTFNNATLERIGRFHTAEDVIDKYLLARKEFDFDINMDLIAGLDGESVEDFKKSVDKAIELSPDNITVHTLCLKKGSALKEEESRLDGAGVEEMVEYAHSSLDKAGYSPYYLYRQKYMAGNLENTGYAKQGKACVYNVDIMEEISDNVACGANAVSKALFDGGERIERYANPKDIPTYVAKLQKIKEEKKSLFAGNK
ncbi:MAG: radical SAM protein, partial [Clostridia bacterium]|nr:radical SAM protein [Clostridia bacterium]